MLPLVRSKNIRLFRNISQLAKRAFMGGSDCSGDKWSYKMENMVRVKKEAKF